MKTMGIIGGLGPQTTANFFMEVVLKCAKINKLEQPEILIQNVKVPFELQEKFIMKGEGGDEFLKILVDSAKKLEKAGADFLVIPCNSVHVFIDEIRNSVKIPVLSILDETADFISSKKLEKVILLATPSTIKNKLFDEKLSFKNIEILKPIEEDQVKIGKIINKILERKERNSDKLNLLKIIGKFDDADALVLACTDLHILLNSHKNLEIVDTMTVLADASVKEVFNTY